MTFAIAALFLSGWNAPSIATLEPVTAIPTLTIEIAKPTIAVSPTLYGIFFEEINHAGDGGIYAEMVRNRGFEDGDTLRFWSAEASDGAKGAASIDATHSFSQSSPKALKVFVEHPGKDGMAVINEGYWGMGVRSGETYALSLHARHQGPTQATIEATLESSGGKVLAKAKFTGVGESWTARTATIQATSSDPKARLVLRIRDQGTTWLDQVSLFPTGTFKNRPNGLRPDLAKMIADMKPSFVRFPGGCWVEGDTMKFAYRWKDTIGPLENRVSKFNLWNYLSTNGLGYHEYLQMCEDLNAEPLFVINCGMSHIEVVPMDKMDEYVQDALDAIEYANGPASSTWGAARSKAGHPEPFGIKYMQIGNENGGPAYNERYALFVKAIKAKYPEIKIIANLWGGVPDSAPIEIVDEHYYSTPEFFMQNADRYDRYDRKGPKIYVGEYAVTQGSGNGNLIGALAEAAFMTGMERNCDVVVMSSYAPLLAHVDGKAWNPDLIYFDSTRVVGTPSYYVQQLFGENLPKNVLRSTLSDVPVQRKQFQSGGIGVGTWNTQAEFKDFRVISGTKTLFESKDGSGLKTESGSWELINGAFRQSGGEMPTRAFIGDSSWSDYTLTLKARKLSGAEGFLISVGRASPNDYLWWNIGGWGNTNDAIELSVKGAKRSLGRQVPHKVETGRWYLIRIDYLKDRVRCLLDGKVVFDERYPVVPSLFAVAGTDSGTTIVKVVNVAEADQHVLVALDGAKTPGGAGIATTLTGLSADAENTLDSPRNVVPTTRPFTYTGKSFRYKFPARSLTVLRWESPRS